MKNLKLTLTTLAIIALILAPLPAGAADLDEPRPNLVSNPIETIFNGVTCAVITIVTLPVLILTGEQIICRNYGRTGSY